MTRERAGLKAGDVIGRINGVPFRMDKMFDVYAAAKATKRVRVELLRDAKPRTLVYRLKDKAAAESPRPAR